MGDDDKGEEVECSDTEDTGIQDEDGEDEMEIEDSMW